MSLAGGVTQGLLEQQQGDDARGTQLQRSTPARRPVNAQWELPNTDLQHPTDSERPVGLRACQGPAPVDSGEARCMHLSQYVLQRRMHRHGVIALLLLCLLPTSARLSLFLLRVRYQIPAVQNAKPAGSLPTDMHV